MLAEFKTFSIALGVSLLFGGVSAAAPVESAPLAEVAPAPLELSLEAMMQRLTRDSPAVLVERESVRRALEQSFQQRADLWPQIELRAAQTRQQFGRGFAGDQFEAPPFNSFAARVEGTLSLLDTQRYAAYRLARLQHFIAEMDYAVAVQEILEQAVQLYFTHLRDLRRVEIARGNLERNRALLQLTEEQLAAGVAVAIDRTRAQVQVAAQQRSLMRAQTAVQASSLQLKALLALDLDRPLQLDRSLIHQIKPPSSLERLAAGGQAGINQRAELASQQRQLQQAQLARKAAGWQRLPKLELFGNWGYDSNEAWDGGHAEAWLVGIRASMPLFDGMRIAAKQREAAAAVRQSEHQMRVVRNHIEQQFRVAQIEMAARYAEIAIAGDEIRLGRDEVAQAEQRYRAGLADNRELIAAQQRLADAEGSHLGSVYLYGLSRLAFARAIGAVERVLD